jgi:putative ABC transport system permease protein
MIVLRWLIAPAVLIYQSLFLALGQVWANKLRSFLTTLGIVIAVGSVTSVIAALAGLKQNVLERFEKYGANRVFIYPTVPDDGHHHRWAELRFKPREFDGLLEHCPDVSGVTRTCDGNRMVSFGAHTRQIDVVGIEPSWHEVANRPVIMGRPFSLIDNALPRAVCLINNRTRDALDLDADPTGQALLISGRRFVIIGMVDEGIDSDGPLASGGNGLEVFIPFKIAFHRDDAVWGQATARSPEVSAEARGEMHVFFRRTRHLGATKPDDFELWAVQKELDNFQSVSVAVTAVAGGIVGISLLVGGVGIMNIMLVSVSERTREIGLRKAVGARPSAILLQFLVEAMVLCLLGGIVGLLAGEGITALFRSVPAAKLDKASIPGWAITISFGFAAMVGLVFGMFPAIKAARLDPIEALRHE